MLDKMVAAYRDSKKRAKEYALADTTPKPFDHLLKVRILTLFRPKYGLSLDLFLIFAGGWFFGLYGGLCSVLVGACLCLWWKYHTKSIQVGLMEFLGNCAGFAVGITTPRPRAASPPVPSRAPQGL